MKLILIRHGETIDNGNNICQGQRHGELSQKGVQQAQLVSELLAEDHSLKIDLCFSSDLNRALSTSRIVALPYSLLVQEDTRLRERYFGRHQGMVMLDDWDGLSYFEDAESIEDMERRLTDFIFEIMPIHQSKTILIISHGVTLRLLTAICLQCEVGEWQQTENCSITLLESEHDSLPFSMVDYNNVSHLKVKKEGGDMK